MSPDQVGSEWPLSVAADRISSAPLTMTVEADAPVRAALARRFGIIAIRSFSAELTLRRLTDGDVAVSAHLKAELTQSCVVTLDPVDETVDETVEGRFTERPEEACGDVVVEPDDDTDEPEPIVDGQLRLGEWLAQNLSLVMNPFPRAADAALDPRYDTGPAEDAGPQNRPFAALAKRRGRPDIKE